MSVSRNARRPAWRTPRTCAIVGRTSSGRWRGASEHEPRPIRKFRVHRLGDGQGQPRLASAGRTGEREQSNVRIQQGASGVLELPRLPIRGVSGTGP